MKSPLVPALMALALMAAGLGAAPLSFKGYSFDAYVLQGGGGRYKEFQEAGRPTLKVRPGEEYSIVVRNPLPVRVGVAVSVDGLNTVDGKRTTPRKARKWMIDPHGSITITGWQTGSSTNRRFVFTRDEASYAQWREGKDGKPYTQNLGVIGVAWFWNAEELQRVLNPPKPFDDEVTTYSRADGDGSRGKRKPAAPAPEAPSSAAEGRAGTGMGREQQHQVTEVEFNPTAGMYSVKDVLKIFYEFAQEPQGLQPFISDDDDGTRFSPEMPVAK